MGKEQKAWAAKKTKELKEFFRYVCNECKRRFPPYQLQFDCIIPQGDYHHRKLGYDCRIRFYIKQLEAGNLQLLCLKCHAKKSVTEHPLFEEEPF